MATQENESTEALTHDELTNKEVETSSPANAAPVSQNQRIVILDILRGFALLGILAMNIVSFGWPFLGYETPQYSGGDGLGNRISWSFNTLIFSGKMMSLFSILFGAGFALQAQRIQAVGRKYTGLYYRRVFWLLVIGLIHGYLFWSGDILVTYAVCGAFLFLFRNRSIKTLVILAVILITISCLTMAGLGAMMGWMRSIATEAGAIQESGGELTPMQEGILESWEGARANFDPRPEQFQEQVKAFRGGYLEILPHRALETLMSQLVAIPIMLFWGVSGRMLLGIALVRNGFLTGECSLSTYLKTACWCYGIGLPLTIAGACLQWSSDFDALTAFTQGGLLVSFGMVPVALGHASVLILLWKKHALGWLSRRLAAVGRMALTNYLMQTLIATTLFYGYGFNLFGTVDRVGLWLVVVSIWGLQLWYSPRWLSSFRFGPAEWLWRSLTYWRIQPIRRSTTEAPA